mmetsp:Transcript_131445/g.262286  ORF Transcript_131445/g.262286 Transcript_131445/m.262286 type:complete len:93 (-) Transcript_131445:780-1058(-)
MNRRLTASSNHQPSTLETALMKSALIIKLKDVASQQWNQPQATAVLDLPLWSEHPGNNVRKPHHTSFHFAMQFTIFTAENLSSPMSNSTSSP